LLLLVAVGVLCVSTYKTVRLVPRPWKLPEGTVNHVSLRTLLRGVMMHIMDNPGITGDGIVQKYMRWLQPVPLFELIEVIISSRKQLIKYSNRCGNKLSNCQHLDSVYFVVDASPVFATNFR